MRWAERCYRHAEIHLNLIKSVPYLKELKLTNMDDEIYDLFSETFPDMCLDFICEDSLKSAPSKAKWRDFCNLFDGRVEDFNFGTLLRLDASKSYTEDNTCVGEIF